MLPKISVITPSFNQGHFIEQTIQSVLSQAYPALEYIIIDGGSTDDTVSIIKKYEKHISYWESEKDNGQSEAINKGFKRATGDVINWLNSDDYYEPGVLLKIGEAFNDENVNVVCGRSKVFGNGKNHLTNGTDIYADNLFKTIGWARIDQPETFFRFSALREIGFVNEELHFVMDKELWLRYLLKYGLDNVLKLPIPFVNYRLHENSKTVSLQDGFEEETRNLFYTLARKFSLKHFYFFLEQKFETRLLALNGYEQIIDRKKANQIVNYYFLQQALVNYAKDNYALAKDFIIHIAVNELQNSDQKELRTIQNRMKLPLGVKRFFHFVKGNK